MIRDLLPEWTRTKPPTMLERLAERLDPMAALLLDDAGEPVLVVDRDGAVVCGNAGMERLLGGSGSGGMGAACEMLFHVQTRHLAWREVRAVLACQLAKPRSFVTRLEFGGGEQEFNVSVIPLREAAQEVSGALLRFADLTAQRQLEAQLAHSQKLQATGQLAGGIAHDFNNLLTAVLGAAEGIIDREAEGDTAEDARQIRASADRGAALVRQLLAFGRQQTLQPRTLAVNEVIEDVSKLLNRLLGGKVRLVLELERPGRLVRADPTQIDQVLVNLAVNGRDAMPEGGTLTLRSGHITVFRPLIERAETIPPGRYVMIEVQDTGLGIAPEVLPRIFDPFFSTRRDAGGSGLGLSTVHGIVRQSGGFIAVDSEVGVGTSMRLYLPRWDGLESAAVVVASAAVSVGAVAPDTRTTTGVVLLVDDEDGVRRLAARALQRAGWEVLQADSAEAAIELVRSRPEGAADLSALISDMMMPGMDGAALALALRGRADCRDLPVILVSGYTESPIRGGLDTVATVFLAKPYRLGELTATLRRILAPQQELG